MCKTLHLSCVLLLTDIQRHIFFVVIKLNNTLYIVDGYNLSNALSSKQVNSIRRELPYRIQKCHLITIVRAKVRRQINCYKQAIELQTRTVSTESKAAEPLYVSETE